MPRKSREEWKVYKNVFDEFTIRLIFKLSSQGHFEELKSPISIGKEANIFSAVRKDGKKVIVKIYRLEACNFNKMYDYIKYDPRFSEVKKNRRKVIFTWVQREYRNLLKAREAGVRVPTPLACTDHVLVMEFIGNEEPAPKVKDLKPENPKEFFSKIIEYMRLMYQKGGLIHGDLSEYNILNFNENPVFIDFTQGTIIKSPRADELLERDIKNICKFAKKCSLNLKDEDVKKRILEKI